MPPNPTVLAFDTSAAHCAAVLVLGGKTLPPIIEPMQKGQSERLFPLLEDLLTQHGTHWSDLDAIAVCTGPGNFTGVRISVASARGLALSLKIPAIGISRLDAIAYNTKRTLTAAVDARQNRFYTQIFTDGKPSGEIALTDQSTLATQPVILTDAAHDSIPQATLVCAENFVENLALCALPLIGTTTDRPAPIYVKAPDAALPSDPPPTILP